MLKLKVVPRVTVRGMWAPKSIGDVKDFPCSNPSMPAERKNTVCSHKHSFTPYPSFSIFTDRQKDGQRPNTLAARGLEELFSSCAVVSVFWLWWEIGFVFTYLHTLLNKLFYKLIVF
jgi:hypothetical protein